MQQNKSFSSINMNDLLSLQFTFAVMKEVMRLQNPIMIIILQLEDDYPTYALSNGLTFRQNDSIFVNMDFLRKNDEVFEHGLEFRPDRWMISDETKLAEMEKNARLFGGGPRICPGQLLARMNAVLTISLLAYHFDMSLNCPPKEVFRSSSVMAIPNKMPLQFKAIQY